MHYYRFYVLPAALIAAFCALFFPAPPGRAEDFHIRIIATVDGAPVTSEAVLQQAYLEFFLSGLPISENLKGPLLERALGNLVEQRIKSARLRHFDFITQEDIDHVLDSMAQDRQISRAAFLEEAAAAGVPPATLMNFVRAAIGWQAFLRQSVSPQMIEQRLQSALKKARDGLLEPYIRLSILLLSTKTDPLTAAQNNLARSLREDLQKYKTANAFAGLAQSFSQHPSKSGGGEIGWYAFSALDPVLRKVLADQTEGFVTDLLTTAHGTGFWRIDARQMGPYPLDFTVHMIRLKVPAPRRPALEALLAQARNQSCENRIRNLTEAGFVPVEAAADFLGWAERRRFFAGVLEGRPLWTDTAEAAEAVIVCRVDKPTESQQKAFEDRLRQDITAQQVEQKSRTLYTELLKQSQVEVRQDPRSLIGEIQEPPSGG